MRRSLRVVLGLILAFAGAGLLVLGAAPSHAASNCNDDGTIKADATVIIKNLSYDPADIALPAVDETVCWWHQDGSTPHTVTLDNAPGQSSFDSHPNCHPGGDTNECFKQGDQPILLTFHDPGTYRYHCKIHSTMHGTVTVAGPPTTSIVNPTTPTTAHTTTTRATTQTTIGTLTPLTTTSTVAGDATSASTTSTSVGSTSSTQATTVTSTFNGSAAPKKKSDTKPSGALEAAGVLLLAAAAAALIPGWRRLT